MRRAAQQLASWLQRLPTAGEQRRGFKAVPKKVAVVLQEDLANLGQQGDVLAVRAGHAWNYLLPHKKAKLADGGAALTVKRGGSVSEATVAARGRRAEAAQLDAALRKLLTTPLKIKAAVAREGSDELAEPLTAAALADAVAAQARVALHPLYLAPHGGAVATLGEHEVPLRVAFGGGSEGVLRVSVMPAGPSRRGRAGAGDDASGGGNDDGGGSAADGVPGAEGAAEAAAAGAGDAAKA